MNRKLIPALLFGVIHTASAAMANIGDYTEYPGLDDEKAVVEVVTDKGLTVELVLRCGTNNNGDPFSGIMHYSKVDKLFCSSRHQCFDTLEPAARDTCG